MFSFQCCRLYMTRFEDPYVVLFTLLQPKKQKARKIRITCEWLYPERRNKTRELAREDFYLAQRVAASARRQCMPKQLKIYQKANLTLDFQFPVYQEYQQPRRQKKSAYALQRRLKIFLNKCSSVKWIFTVSFLLLQLSGLNYTEFNNRGAPLHTANGSPAAIDYFRFVRVNANSHPRQSISLYLPLFWRLAESRALEKVCRRTAFQQP